MIGTLKIAICDDDLIFAHEALNTIKRILQDHHEEHSLSVFQTGKELTNAGFYDIIFLDIEMRGLNGLETAKQLRFQEYNSRIIFLTSHKKYVFSAFDVSASHYLLKPVDPQKIESVLIKIINELTAEKEYCYTFKCATQVHRVPFSEIAFVEVLGRKISLHTAKQVFTFNGRLDDLNEAFPNCFFRCHKSFLVNLAMVTAYNKESAVLRNKEKVPIARRKFAEFGTAFLSFLQEEGEE